MAQQAWRVKDKQQVQVNEDVLCCGFYRAQFDSDFDLPRMTWIRKQESKTRKQVNRYEPKQN